MTLQNVTVKLNLEDTKGYLSSLFNMSIMTIKTPCENEYSFMILTESSFPPCLKSFVTHPPEVVMGLTNFVPYRTLRSTGMQVVRNERGLPSRKVEEKSFHRLIITDVVQVNVHFTPQ